MILNSKIKYLIIIIIFQSWNTLFAQNNDTVKYKTEEIKVLSNKIITSEFDSPTKVQIINIKQINNKNGETLSDILQLGGNIFVKSYGANYSLSTISMNGLGAEQTLILLNGFRLNSFQNNQVDLSTIGKDNIESIEILNNGSSSIYGSEAIGGVVNIVTKNNLVNDLEVRLNGEVGSYEQKKVYAGISKRLNNLSIEINYSKETSLNNYEYYFNNGLNKLLKERANSNYDLSNYSLNFDFSAKNINLNFFSTYTDQLRNIPGIETGSAPSNSNQLDKNWNSIFSYKNIISKNSSVKSQINFQNNLSNYTDRNIINSYYKNIVLSNSSQINFTKRNLELVTGFEINYAVLKSDETEDNARRIQPAVFLVSEINLNNMFKLFPSVRYDYISDIKKNVLSGKFGLNIKPFAKHKLNFKAGAGNNFAAPTFNELYWKDLGNKALKPESSVNADAGAIFNFNLFSDNTVELTYTYIDATDKIVWSPDADGLWTPKNIGKSTSNVFLFDVNANKKFTNDISLNIDLTYSFTKSLRKSKDYENDPGYDKQIFYIPEQLAKCNLSFNYKMSGINIFYSFTGKRFINFENTNFLPAVDLFEGNIYQNFMINKFNAQIKAEVNNIFNADYQFISGYPAALRNYKLVLSFEY
ncbi:MAG: TonB-dependent receptor [Bacteroidota bacterium]|nr:TonB-dependent receptor [Bacteroidota bacterium]